MGPVHVSTWGQMPENIVLAKNKEKPESGWGTTETKLRRNFFHPNRCRDVIKCASKLKLSTWPEPHTADSVWSRGLWNPTPALNPADQYQPGEGFEARGRCSHFECKCQQGKGEAKGLFSITRETARAVWAGDPCAWMWDWTALNTANTIQTWKQNQISLPNHTETWNKVNCKTASLAFLLKLSKGIGFKHQFCWQMGWHCNSISST